MFVALHFLTVLWLIITAQNKPQTSAYRTETANGRAQHEICFLSTANFSLFEGTFFLSVACIYDQQGTLKTQRVVKDLLEKVCWVRLVDGELNKPQ